MIANKKVACIIPARLASTRFSEKMLKSILGKPILQWVWEAASKVEFFDSVTIATDSEKIASLVTDFGGKYIMTSENCESGTDRLVEVMQSKKIESDIWVNWQGDEPFITKAMISCLLQSCKDNDADMWTLKKRIESKEQITSPNIAKVVCDLDGYALYFSRSTIPFYRDKPQDSDNVYYKHVGIYAFTTKALQKISELKPSPLEKAEKLEQLRLLQYGLKIKIHETKQEVIGIDTQQDLIMATNHAEKLCLLI